MSAFQQMRARWGLFPVFAIGALLVLGAGIGPVSADDEPGAGDAVEGTPATFGFYSLKQAQWEEEERVREALQQRVSIDFDETPMREALERVAQMLGVEIEFDHQAFADEGLDETHLLQPIVLRLERVPACEVIRAILGPHEMYGFEIWRNAVRITSDLWADESFATRMYDVQRLIALGFRVDLPRPREVPGSGIDIPPQQYSGGFRNVADDSTDTRDADASPARTRIIGLHDDEYYGSGVFRNREGEIVAALPVERRGASLQTLIYRSTEGPWFETDGVGGTMSLFQGQLVIRQDERNHEQIRRLLEVLKVVASSEPGQPPVPIYRDLNDEARAALAKWVTVDFENVPAGQAVEELSRRAGVPVRLPSITWYLDSGQLDELRQTRVTLHADNEPLEDVLWKVAYQLDDDYGFLCVWYGTIQIGSFDDKVDYHDVIYDLRDFDEPTRRDATDLIVHETRGPWFGIAGIGGRLHLTGNGLLIVSQYADVHDEIALRLEDLRKSGAGGAFRDSADDEWTTRIYPIERADAVEWVVDAVETFVRCDSWDVNGGQAAIRGGGHALIVRQTGAGHRDVARLLERIEWAHGYVREHLPTGVSARVADEEDGQ